MMFRTNGKDHGADALTPTPAMTAVTQSPDTTNHSIVEAARFMPVMQIDQAIERRAMIVRAMRELMQEGVDYGKIPGTERPTLLQPGADKLCSLFGLVVQYEETKEEDWTGERHGGEPFFYYKFVGRAYRGEFLMGEGVGCCSSWESKYRWRKAERKCPACGKENIRRSRQQGEGWYCWAKTGGCGATFKEGDKVIEGQEVGRISNPDMADVVNTVLKMAFKRCKVATAMNSTSASEFFTQDVEDFTPAEEQVNTGGYPVGTKAAADYVAQQKLRTGNMDTTPPWSTMGQMARMFQGIREEVGETAYSTELARYGWKFFQDIKAAIDDEAKKSPNSNYAKQKAVECYWHLRALREAA